MLTINGEKVKVLEVCERCGKPNKVETYLFGKFRAIPYPCDCAEDEENTKRENEEERKKSMVVDQLRIRCFENSIFKNATFDRDDRRDPKASDCAMLYAENFDQFKEDGKGLLFNGSVGCGKTFLASCVANYLIADGHECLFVNAYEFLGKLQFSSGEESLKIIKTLNECEILIIDDFIDLNVCVNYSHHFYNLINNRIYLNNPTIITTNFDITSMSESDDVIRQAVSDRVLGSCFPITVRGKSRRNRNLNITAKFKVINCKR